MKSILLVFTSWRMAIVLMTGFSSGIPLALTGSTLQAWMQDLNVDLTVIGAFALVGIPYTLKFLWAPLMDRYVPPFLGRRRGWMILTQALLAASIAALGLTNAAVSPGLVAVIAVLVAFFSSSQDIVIDAYRTELLTADERGPGSGVHILGYRIAMIVSGAIALSMAEQVPWRQVYLIMAATMAVGVIASLLAPEPDVHVKPPKTLAEAVIDPLRDFLSRRGAGEIVAFLIVYKLDTAMTVALMTAFFLSIGFTKTEIAFAGKFFGMVALIVGTLAGGATMVKFGLKKSLWIFGVAQALAGLSFMLVARIGNNFPMMVTAVAAENFFSGMGTAAYMAFMMSQCNKKYTATQYALLTSLMALTRYVFVAPAGWVAKTWGYEHYYLLCILAGIPGLLLLLRYDRWGTPPETQG